MRIFRSRVLDEMVGPPPRLANPSPVDRGLAEAMQAHERARRNRAVSTELEAEVAELNRSLREVRERITPETLRELGVS
jgi:hypothetical protein